VLERKDVTVLREQYLTPFVGIERVKLAAAGEGHQLNFEWQRIVLIVSASPAVQQVGVVALEKPQHFIFICGRSFSGRRVRVPDECQGYRLALWAHSRAVLWGLQSRRCGDSEFPDG
jgi:hypothetical protein